MKNQAAYDTFYKGLQKFIPQKSLHHIATLLAEYHVFLKITPNRKTKYGDYRPPNGQKGHRISINGDLNQYAFLNTLIHELAHLITYKQYARTVKSHGIEWKDNYKHLMSFFLGKDIFPADLEASIKKYFTKIYASSCSDPDLVLAFRKYDKKKNNENDVWITKLIDELENGDKFVSKNKIFVKEKKLRKWYKCIEVATGRAFRFHPSAEVLVSKTDLLEAWTEKLEQEKQAQQKVDEAKIALKDLAESQLFSIKKRVFVKGRKLRTRYECKDHLTGDLYTIGANYMVETVSKNDNSDQTNQKHQAFTSLF